MKVAKLKADNKKNKKEVINEEERYSIKTMIILTISIVLVLTGFYFITRLVVKEEKTTEQDNTVVELDSSKITLNNLLNRTEDEYYVLAYKQSLYKQYSKMNYLEMYQKYIEDYSKKEDALKFYMVDLDDALNKSYESEELNISDNIEELKINNEVLFKVKSGKIEKYFVGSSEITEEFSKIK